VTPVAAMSGAASVTLLAKSERHRKLGRNVSAPSCYLQYAPAQTMKGSQP
jgi:hypothetical protein